MCIYRAIASGSSNSSSSRRRALQIKFKTTESINSLAQTDNHVKWLGCAIPICICILAVSPSRSFASQAKSHVRGRGGCCVVSNRFYHTEFKAIGKRSPVRYPTQLGKCEHGFRYLAIWVHSYAFCAHSLRVCTLNRHGILLRA